MIRSQIQTAVESNALCLRLINLMQYIFLDREIRFNVDCGEP